MMIRAVFNFLKAFWFKRLDLYILSISGWAFSPLPMHKIHRTHTVFHYVLNNASYIQRNGEFCCWSDLGLPYAISILPGVPWRDSGCAARELQSSWRFQNQDVRTTDYKSRLDLVDYRWKVIQIRTNNPLRSHIPESIR